MKELIKYDELNLSEIAVKLGYSSVHYLSSQFKRVTGLSVSDYKEVMKNENRYYKNLSEALGDLREKATPIISTGRKIAWNVRIYVPAFKLRN